MIQEPDSDQSTADRMNQMFDQVIDGKFANQYLVFQACRAILEKFGINLPMLEDQSDDEFIFEVEGTGYFLYIAVDRDDRGMYDAYAQIVTEDELHEIEEMDFSTPELTDDQIQSHWLRQQRHVGNI